MIMMYLVLYVIHVHIHINPPRRLTYERSSSCTLYCVLYTNNHISISVIISHTVHCSGCAGGGEGGGFLLLLVTYCTLHCCYYYIY